MKDFPFNKKGDYYNVEFSVKIVRLKKKKLTVIMLNFGFEVQNKHVIFSIR